MTTLILKHPNGWRENDFDALDAGKIIGRIMLHARGTAVVLDNHCSRVSTDDP
jgi:hypothetical protein